MSPTWSHSSRRTAAPSGRKAMDCGDLKHGALFCTNVDHSGCLMLPLGVHEGPALGAVLTRVHEIYSKCWPPSL